ncbi:MAG: hypothetical protein WCJ62_01595 [Flavobacterium sp.]
MKTKILATMLFITMWGVESCTKDTASGYNSQLPPETQVGANTFGVTINGKVYKPRDPTGNGIYPSSKGMTFVGSSSNNWNEIVVKDGASAVGFKMIIHFKQLVYNYNGLYPLSNSNFQDQSDSLPIDHIYFKIWDSAISNYAYYGSMENLGAIDVTRFNGSTSINWILSGTFYGKFVRYDNPNDFITITDGRFDLNLNTLPNTVFP